MDHSVRAIEQKQALHAQIRDAPRARDPARPPATEGTVIVAAVSWMQGVWCGLTHGHTWSRKFRRGHFGFECVDCLTWRRWLN